MANQYETMKGQLQKVEEHTQQSARGPFSVLSIYMNNVLFDGNPQDHGFLEGNIGQWYEFQYEVQGKYKKLKTATLIVKPKEGATPPIVDLREKAIQLETCINAASVVAAAMIANSREVMDADAVCKLLQDISDERWEWLQAHLKG